MNEAFSLLPPPFNLIPNFLSKDSSNIEEIAGRALLPSFVQPAPAGRTTESGLFSVFKSSSPV
jgi:hypothetical protein